MREADDALIARAALFVDSRVTTLGHIGELILPIASGAITAESVLGDFYDLLRPEARRRRSDDEITLFKNGGGASRPDDRVPDRGGDGGLTGGPM